MSPDHRGEVHRLGAIADRIMYAMALALLGVALALALVPECGAMP